MKVRNEQEEIDRAFWEKFADELAVSEHKRHGIPAATILLVLEELNQIGIASEDHELLDGKLGRSVTVPDPSTCSAEAVDLEATKTVPTLTESPQSDTGSCEPTSLAGITIETHPADKSELAESDALIAARIARTELYREKRRAISDDVKANGFYSLRNQAVNERRRTTEAPAYNLQRRTQYANRISLDEKREVRDYVAGRSKAELMEKDRCRKAAMRASLTEEQRAELREKDRVRKANARAAAKEKTP